MLYAISHGECRAIYHNMEELPRCNDKMEKQSSEQGGEYASTFAKRIHNINILHMDKFRIQTTDSKFQNYILPVPCQYYA